MKTEAMDSNWYGSGYCGLSDPEGTFERRSARQEASSCAKRSPVASGQGELKWPGAPGVPTPARGPLPYLLTHPHGRHCRLHPRRILISPSWESFPASVRIFLRLRSRLPSVLAHWQILQVTSPSHPCSPGAFCLLMPPTVVGYLPGPPSRLCEICLNPTFAQHKPHIGFPTSFWQQNPLFRHSPVFYLFFYGYRRCCLGPSCPHFPPQT